MAKKDIDRRVSRALHALTAGKEESIRDLVSSLEDIAKVDTKILELHERRTELLALMEEQSEAARVAGWKAKDLADAGLAVPRTIRSSGLIAQAPADTAAEHIVDHA